MAALVALVAAINVFRGEDVDARARMSLTLIRAARLKLLRPEGVAARHSSLPEPGVEPALPLCGAAMGEAVGHHPALRAPLQCIVADCGRCTQRRFHIARL